MIKDILKAKDLVFSRRAFIVLSFKISVAITLVVRLFFLQVSKFSEFHTLSDKNRIKFLLLEPLRGVIKDRNGVSLAKNKNNYKLYFYKQRRFSYEEEVQLISSLLGLSQEQQSGIIQQVQKSNYVYPTLIKDDLMWDQVALIEGNKHRLPCTYIDKGYTRFYPFKEMFAQVVGYMGVPRSDEVTQYSLHNIPSFKIGKTGIERVANTKLIGTFGSKKVEVNAFRVIVREFATNKSTKGEDVTLTFDSRLQQYIYDLLPKDGASAVLADVDSGEVLSMVSTPSFDANIFSTKTMNRDIWDKIIKNKSYPFTNRCVGKVYPPGSTWKIIVALAVLAHGVSPTETVYCNGKFKLGNRVYKCWKHSGHGNVNVSSAIMMSCNVYFYEMSLRVGISAIHKIAAELGFGDVVCVDIPGEVRGLNPNKEWKKNTLNDEWVLGDTANSSIGQGYTLATPIQILTMISRVVTGKKFAPKILFENVNGGAQEAIHIQQQHLEIVKNAMASSFNNPHGLGYNFRIVDKNYSIAGKSGTSQIVSRDTSLLGNDHKGVKSHAVFVGYAPVYKPKYSIVVTVDNAGWGSKNAAPIAREILYYTQKYLKT